MLINFWPLRLQPPESFDFDEPYHSMASTQKVTIILDGTHAWHDWLEVVKTKARAGKVWEYIDPSLPADRVKQLIEPRKPRPSDVKQDAVSTIDLNEEERKSL